MFVYYFIVLSILSKHFCPKVPLSFPSSLSDPLNLFYLILLPFGLPFFLPFKYLKRFYFLTGIIFISSFQIAKTTPTYVCRIFDSHRKTISIIFCFKYLKPFCFLAGIIFILFHRAETTSTYVFKMFYSHKKTISIFLFQACTYQINILH